MFINPIPVWHKNMHSFMRSLLNIVTQKNTGFRCFTGKNDLADFMCFIQTFQMNWDYYTEVRAIAQYYSRYNVEGP